ncbi:hypothetical protein AURDEDRAFT_178422 [Auricularia subglabra TFB-10046 SS5]|uniref:Uncharacterized protein n=1 Tax=Auricularia subglabra (strain TFB-10046 / SS5) TaxID=717982 RepID=J0L867_AURST|nr:hypothetical protein AURDEDRAFT_178422 [Auricularia subglabra TFB-10046 SS5]
MYGTPFVEHFFGLARMMLPNFIFAEFLEMVKQYSLEYHASKPTAEDICRLTQFPTRSDLDHLASLAEQEEIAMCKSLVNMTAPPLPWHLAELQAPKPSKHAATTSQDADNDVDSDGSSDDEMQADDEENVVVRCAENEDGKDAEDISLDTALVDAGMEHSGPLPAPVPRPTTSSSAAASEPALPQDLRRRLYFVGSIVIRAAESPLQQRRLCLSYIIIA